MHATECALSEVLSGVTAKNVNALTNHVLDLTEDILASLDQPHQVQPFTQAR